MQALPDKNQSLRTGQSLLPVPDVRNIRQDENNKIKKDEELREDERDMCLEIVQELIEKYNKIVEDKFKEKETELTSI